MVDERSFRERQIEQVAGILREFLDSPAVLSATREELLLEARTTNDYDGWTFDMAGGGPRNYLLCEGVHLNDAEWTQAVALAESWLNQLNEIWLNQLKASVEESSDV